MTKNQASAAPAAPAVPNQNDDLPPIPTLEEAASPPQAQDYAQDQSLREKTQLEEKVQDAKDAFKKTLFGRFLNFIGFTGLLNFIAEYLNEGVNDAKRNLENYNRETRTNELETTKQNLNKILGKDENGDKLPDSEEVARKNKKAEVLFGDDVEKKLVQKVNTKLAEEKLRDAVGKKVDIEGAITAAKGLLAEATKGQGIFYAKDGAEIKNIGAAIQKLYSERAEADKEIGKCKREYQKELSKLSTDDTKELPGQTLENLKSELNTKQSAIAGEKIEEAKKDLQKAKEAREQATAEKVSLHSAWKEAAVKAAFLQAEKKSWFGTDSDALQAANKEVQRTLEASKGYDTQLLSARSALEECKANLGKCEKALQGLQAQQSSISPAPVVQASEAAKTPAPVAPAPVASASVPEAKVAEASASAQPSQVPAPFAAPTPPVDKSTPEDIAKQQAMSNPEVIEGLAAALAAEDSSAQIPVPSAVHGQGQGKGQVNDGRNP